MAETGALARPHKSAAVGAEIKDVALLGHVEPILVLLGENCAGVARCRIGEKQIEPCLRAIHSLDGHTLRVTQPLDASQQHRRIRAGVEPTRRTARDGDYADFRDGIPIARGGVAFVHRRAERIGHVHERIAIHGPLVELEKRHVRGVRRPPVGGVEIELFGVHPVEFAVAQFFAAAACELAGRPGCDICDPEVVLAEEADPFAVRRNFWIVEIGPILTGFRGQRVNDCAAGLRSEIVPIEFGRRGEQQRCAVRRPEIGSGCDAAQAGLLASRDRGVKKIGEKAGRDEHLLLAAFRINDPEFGARARGGFVCAQVRELSAVGTPRQRFELRACQRGGAIDSLDGERARLLRARGGAKRNRQRERADCEFHAGFRGMLRMHFILHKYYLARAQSLRRTAHNVFLPVSVRRGALPTARAARIPLALPCGGSGNNRFRFDLHQHFRRDEPPNLDHRRCGTNLSEDRAVCAADGFPLRDVRDVDASSHDVFETRARFVQSGFKIAQDMLGSGRRHHRGRRFFHRLRWPWCRKRAQHFRRARRANSRRWAPRGFHWKCSGAA